MYSVCWVILYWWCHVPCISAITICFVTSLQIADMSLQVSSVRKEVSQALQEVENGQVSPINTDSSKILTKGEAVLSLLEYVNEHQFVKAVQLLRSFRYAALSELFYVGFFYNHMILCLFLMELLWFKDWVHICTYIVYKCYVVYL